MKKNKHVDVVTPWQRLVRILHYERNTINYIFVYAILIGLIGLTLPLGTTAVFNLLSNGAMYSSTYLLIAVVLIGIVIGGCLLIGQYTLVEFLEQKIFTKASMEFAYRLPRIKKSEWEGEHPPELVNRFFDILTIQKGLTKLLIDIVAAAVQVFFSAILLSFYHPVFMAVGLLAIIAIVVIVLLYYRQGVETSLDESHYKYELVAHLEDVAGDLDSYRNNPEMMDRVVKTTDDINAKYLTARNSHFSVLRKYLMGSVALRTILMGALLLLGSFFVVERQMTFGQFVAAEVIIVQISYAIEKLLTNMNTVFDMVTGSEKLAVVTDLEMEGAPQHG
ncbi:ABC transporter ATP-binding protein [Mucilaginibacter achroorhodeus]|uniref:ABC transporter ATP-binding protein n=1 Tax=Mucilaginibacter achroorhodeus TaxID=2599294 RepID=A0A563U3V3_9SPHI|nr:MULTISPECIES: ABC transporter transmembrane domain-containing protein [Mucilaginibacter]QXV64503.1 ABC transporter ATP-binding protein [Mucilaginibacter sp. 21P]TWR26010.1 ABC transporter ATP-binding protein [Mucilaginibacter achroorhodeus]